MYSAVPGDFFDCVLGIMSPDAPLSAESEINKTQKVAGLFDVFKNSHQHTHIHMSVCVCYVITSVITCVSANSANIPFDENVDVSFLHNAADYNETS